MRTGILVNYYSKLLLVVILLFIIHERTGLGLQKELLATNVFFLFFIIRISFFFSREVFNFVPVNQHYTWCARFPWKMYQPKIA